MESASAKESSIADAPSASEPDESTSAVPIAPSTDDASTSQLTPPRSPPPDAVAAQDGLLVGMAAEAQMSTTPAMDVDTADPRVCKMCSRGGDGGPEERLLYVRALDLWVHLNCALWSSEVYEAEDGELVKVDSALTRSQRMVRSVADVVAAPPPVRDGAADPSVPRASPDPMLRSHGSAASPAPSPTPPWAAAIRGARPTTIFRVLAYVQARRDRTFFPFLRRALMRVLEVLPWTDGGQAAGAVFLSDKRVFCPRHVDKDAVRAAVAEGMAMDEFEVPRRGTPASLPQTPGWRRVLLGLAATDR